MEFSFDNIPVGYSEVLGKILEEGKRVSPRGKATVEISPLMISSSNPRKRFITHRSRRANPVFSLVELFWILRGEERVEMLTHYASGMQQYANPLTGKMDGAYGRRIMAFRETVNQLDLTYHRLRFDHDTRRAIIVLYDPAKDWNEESRDIPCNVALHFMIRNQRLNMTTFLRSQDMFLGFVYDTEEWQLLMELLAGWLGIDVGTYTHIISSAHLYENDIPAAREIHDEDCDFYSTTAPIDARITREETRRFFPLLYRVEENTRCGEFDNLELEKITNEFWKSAGYAIAAFNALRLKERKRLDLFSELLSHVSGDLRERLRLWVPGNPT